MSNIRKTHFRICTAVFLAIAGYQTYKRCERYSHCERGPKLSDEKLMELGRVGDIDTENNGYDIEEARCYTELLDEIRFHNAALKAMQKVLNATMKVVAKITSRMANLKAGNTTHFATLEAAVETTHEATLDAMFKNLKATMKTWKENRNLQSQMGHLLWDILYLLLWYVVALLVCFAWGSSQKEVETLTYKWKKLKKEMQDAEDKTKGLEAEKEKLKRTLKSKEGRSRKGKKILQEKLATVNLFLKCAKQKQKEKEDEMAMAEAEATIACWPGRNGNSKTVLELHGQFKATLTRVETELFGWLGKKGVKLFEKKGKLGDGMDGAFKCHVLAKDGSKKGELCVKVGSAVDCKKRMLREANILRKLQAKDRSGTPKHVVSLRDVVEAGERIYIVTELVSGMDIQQYLKKRGPFLQKAAATLFRYLCLALMFCHDNGIVHGDVKPENVMVSETAEGLLATLIDFGRASASFLGEDDLLWLNEDPLAAPEALENKGSTIHGNTKQGDIFRLGCTLYMMLCNTPPFAWITSSDNRKLACPASLDNRKAGEVEKCYAYEKLSKDAKELIHKLLTGDIDLKQAMSHKWVEDRIKAADADAELERRLRSWNQAALKAELRKRKVPEEEIEKCDDTEDTKEAFITLLMNNCM